MGEPPPAPNPINAEFQFFDTLDDFDFFFDCIPPPEPQNPPTQLESTEVRDDPVVIDDHHSSNEQTGLRRRPSNIKVEFSGSNSTESLFVFDGASHRKKRDTILSALKGCESVKQGTLSETTQVQESGHSEQVESASSGVIEGNESSIEKNVSKSTVNSGVFQGVSPRKRRNKILSALKECERSKEGNVSETTQVQESSNRDSAENRLEELDNSSFLVYLAGLVIKAISFQASLLFNFFSFPIWVSYFSVMFMIHPYGTLKQVKNGILKRFNGVWRVFTERVAPFLFEKIKGQKTIANLVLRFGWGFVCSLYICFVLFGFLVSGFVGGGILMRYLVEEPVQMTESLNFDYTRSNPVALVPIISCPAMYSGVRYIDDVAKTKAHRILPPNQKLQLTISLALPESDYNRQLGVFQLRVDFLSETGEATASSRLPCMLRFKSHIIRHLETFLKSVPLLAGYASEAQLLKVKMRGFTEGKKSTSCLRVILEQRAEYKSGAGIPEIYTASLLLESELPLFKRILWYWKKTIYIWTSLMLFTMQLMLGLLCCRPILIPRARLGESSATSNAPQSTVAPAISS